MHPEGLIGFRKSRGLITGVVPDVPDHFTTQRMQTGQFYQLA